MTLIRKLSGATLLALALSMASVAVQAHDYTAGSVRVDHPFSVPTPPGARAAGVWIKALVNEGREADRLVSASTPVAGRVEIHTMSMDGGVMRMREIGALDLAPGQRLEMRPRAGEHLMLMELKRPLKDGDSFPMTLQFERGGKVDVKVVVQVPKARGGAGAAADAGHAGEHGHAAGHGQAPGHGH